MSTEPLGENRASCAQTTRTAPRAGGILILVRTMWIDLAGHAALVTLFGSAALGKLRSLQAFADHLQVPFGRASGKVARVAICGEVALTALLLVGIGNSFVLIAAGVFLAAASIFLAWRLLLRRETDCVCWGMNARSNIRKNDIIGWDLGQYNVSRNVFNPAWYGIRNGLGLALISILIQYSSTDELYFYNIYTVAALAFPLCMTNIGLLISIFNEKRLLSLDEHPKKQELAPRLVPLVAISWYMKASNVDVISRVAYTQRGLSGEDT